MPSSKVTRAHETGTRLDGHHARNVLFLPLFATSSSWHPFPSSPFYPRLLLFAFLLSSLSFSSVFRWVCFVETMRPRTEGYVRAVCWTLCCRDDVYVWYEMR